MNAAARHLGINGMRDMDYVITTRELAMLAKDENIDFAALEDRHMMTLWDWGQVPA